MMGLFQNGFCVCCVSSNVFSFRCIDSLQGEQRQRRSIEREDQSEHYFKRAYYQWSSYPSSWWDSTSLHLYCHDTKHFNHFVSHLPLFSLLVPPAWTCRETTTLVTPLDLSGSMLSGRHPFRAEPVFTLTHCPTANVSYLSLHFIVALLFIFLSFYCSLVNSLFFLMRRPFCSSPQVAGTSSFAGFLLRKEVSAAARWATANIF